MKLALLALTAALTAAEAPRIFVANSKSWEAYRGTGGSSPQTIEVMKTFRERCPAVVVIADKDKADYVVLFDREGFKGLARKDSKIAVFNRAGEAVFTKSTRTVGSAVKEACRAIGAK